MLPWYDCDSIEENNDLDFPDSQPKPVTSVISTENIIAELYVLFKVAMFPFRNCATTFT